MLLFVHNRLDQDFDRARLRSAGGGADLFAVPRLN
jgi:hypothetical protein